MLEDNLRLVAMTARSDEVAVFVQNDVIILSVSRDEGRAILRFIINVHVSRHLNLTSRCGSTCGVHLNRMHQWFRSVLVQDRTLFHGSFKRHILLQFIHVFIRHHVIFIPHQLQLLLFTLEIGPIDERFFDRLH